MSAGTVVAVDLGATSGRVILGRIGDGELRLDDVHRFPNGPVELRDGLHWDMLGLYAQVLEGLRRAHAAAGGDTIASIAIDSWGVDLVIDEHTKLDAFRDQLRWNDLYWHWRRASDVGDPMDGLPVKLGCISYLAIGVRE